MTWAAEQGLTGNRINSILESMRVAVRYAVSREEIEKDPFKNIREAPEKAREKGVLTPAEVSRLIHAPLKDPRSRLAVLLGALCGLRRGECRGMQWGDIHDGIIDVCHNYVNYEGMKDTPKWGSTRVVPLPDEVAEVLEVVKTTLPFEIRPNGFVFESLENPGQPMGETFFRNSLERELVAIGIAGSWHGKKVAPESYVNEQSKRNLTFHGLRHTFITLSRLAGISDLEIQTLGGHKSGEMMNRYTHAAQVMDMSAVKAKIEKALAKPVTTEHSSIASQSTTELTLAEGSL